MIQVERFFVARASRAIARVGWGLAVAALLLAIPLAARDKLTPEQARSDLDLFWRSLSEIHPQLDRTCPLDELQGDIARIGEWIRQPRTRPEFFLRLNQVVAKVRDSHTILSYPSFPEEQTFPPFDLLPVGGDAVLVRAYAPGCLPFLGQQVQEINGRSWADIYRNATAALAGETEEIRRSALQSDSFKIIWDCLYPTESRFTLKFASGVVGPVPGVTRQEIKAARRRNAAAETNEPIRIWREGDIALVAIQALNGTSVAAEWKRIVQDLAAAPPAALVLDLRGNAGGEIDVAEGIAASCVGRAVRFYPQVTVRVSRLFLDHAKKRIPGILRFLPLQLLDSRGRKLFRAPLGSRVPFHDEDPPTPPLGVLGPIPMWVLIDGSTASAAASLARHLQFEKRAVVVGRPAGSLRDGLFGEPLRVELPNSGLLLSVPSMVLTRSGETANAAAPPLEPDVRFEYDPGLRIARRDDLLDQTLALIKTVVGQPR